jgi:hypothetical protein
VEKEKKKKVVRKEKWGVFYNSRNEGHVIPCYEDGLIAKPHINDRYCVCEPKREKHKDDFTEQYYDLFIHNQFN